jgi:xylan 1,4-beta-xylosidase
MPQTPNAGAHITVDLSAEHRPPKRRLHGVNNGPVGYGSLIDVSHHFKALGIPSVRLHDPDWPHPRSVDIPQLFPDATADPDDPGNYDFLRTDEYVRSVLDTGARIVYRLGTSIEHTTVKTFTHPPADNERWARVCTRIIDHYNDGWADGFHYGIDYWEIWNEPDVPSQLMWSGTAEQYFELYRVAATAIKTAHPEVKVGGPAAARGGDAGDLADRFVAFCSKEQLPLDFFSWHIYTDSVDAIAARAEWARGLLDSHGFSDTESHFNEWNYMTGDFWTMWQQGLEHERQRVFSRQKDREGAAFAVAVLLSLQNLPVDVANYYDGQPSALFCGLFDPYGVPQKTFYGFQAYRELCSADHLVSTTVTPDADGLRAGAAVQQDGDVTVVMSDIGAATRELRLEVRGLEPGGSYACEVRVVDDEHDLDLVATSSIDSESMTLDMAVEPHSVLLLTVRRT